jgi:hypothetical protein
MRCLIQQFHAGIHPTMSSHRLSKLSLIQSHPLTSERVDNNLPVYRVEALNFNTVKSKQEIALAVLEATRLCESLPGSSFREY